MEEYSSSKMSLVAKRYVAGRSMETEVKLVKFAAHLLYMVLIKSILRLVIQNTSLFLVFECRLH